MGLLDKFSSGASKPPTPLRSKYTIEQAIKLMRSLPASKDMNLVIHVMKATLDSLNVDVSGIVADAERKLGKIQTKIDTFSDEIEKFEKEIAARREAIDVLKQEFKETHEIKGQLEVVRDSTDEESVKAAKKTKEPAPKKAEPKAEPKGEEKDEKSKSSFFKRKDEGGEPKKA
jgi:peptidoglycan hydrolase CwlO-like protein